MYARRTGRIFVSHRHAYEDDYWSLKRRMEAWGLEVQDGSWHTHKLQGRISQQEIARRLRASISWCNVFIIVARMATQNSEWCKWEVETADALGKHILAYSPRGMSRLPTFITGAANYYSDFSRVDRLDNLLDDLLA